MALATDRRIVVTSVRELTAADVERDLPYIDTPDFNTIPEDEHPAFFAWDLLIDEVRAEVAPELARLMTEAINRRLPWTWEPER